MEIYTTEEEQAQKIKKAIREYAPTVIISLLIVITGTFGWRYWHTQQEQRLMVASSTYEQMLVSSRGNDKDAIQLQAKHLIKTYPKTPYAKLAALLLAKEAVEVGHFDEADKQLQWVIKNGKNQVIQQIARNREARVLLAQNKPQKALDMLAKVDDSSYQSAIDVIRGDAYLALGNRAAARKAYQNALASQSNQSKQSKQGTHKKATQGVAPQPVNWPILKMKLAQLATSTSNAAKTSVAKTSPTSSAIHQTSNQASKTSDAPKTLKTPNKETQS